MFDFLKKKRDVYQVKIIGKKRGVENFSFFSKIDVPKDFFPRRRFIAKLYGKEITLHILKNRRYGVIIEVVILSKVGTFNREYLKTLREMGDL